MSKDNHGSGTTSEGTTASTVTTTRTTTTTARELLTAHELLTVGQAAAYLQVSASSIRSYIRQGKLQAFRVAGLRKVLISKGELLLLLEPAIPSIDLAPAAHA